MEDSQRKHITKNLTILIESVRCTLPLLVGLVRRKIITIEEQEYISSQKTNYDKSYHLLILLLQRKDGYKGLVFELRETNQSGALEILEEITCPEEVSLSDYLRPGSKSSCSAIQNKMELFLDQNHEMFTKISSDAIREILGAFYDEQMENLKKGIKYFGPNVLSEFHKKISDSMTEGTAKMTISIPTLKRIHEILNQIFKENEIKYVIGLNGNKNFNEAPAIGIDLGTCNCCTSVCLEGKVIVFSNTTGEKSTPSYVSFNMDGTETIGKAAKRFSYRNPEYTIYDSKRMLGRKFSDQQLQKDRQMWQFKVIDDKDDPKIVTQNEALLPIQISSKLLMECRKQAENHLKMTVTKAVVTVPAYFNDKQLRATKEAACLAGIEILCLLKEPTAAAITYRQERLHNNAKTVLIFDMGGGTFDVAVATIGDDVKILGIDGDTHLGGQDFDQCIAKYCMDSFEREQPDSYLRWSTESKIKRNMANLLLACEEGKKDLTHAEEVEIIVDLATDYAVTLTRETFVKITSTIHTKVMRLVERVLESTKMSPSQIEDIILVGGSSRNRKLREFLEQYFQKDKLNPVVHEDYAVAYGAAIHAAKLQGLDACKVLNLERIEEVVPMSLGVQVVKDGVPGHFGVIIMKHSKYPHKYEQKYLTHKNNQEYAVIRVYQGEHDNVTDNFFLGCFRIGGIPKAPKGSESINVCMEIDKMGILHVSAYSNGKKGKETLDVEPFRDLISRCERHDSSGSNYNISLENLNV